MDGLVQLKRANGSGASAPRGKLAPKPEWLKVRLPTGEGYTRVRNLLHGLNLHTVCEESRCPNVAECWGGGTATVMLMGDVCSRGCRFCHVANGGSSPSTRRSPSTWPRRWRSWDSSTWWSPPSTGTSSPDQGAGHFARAIRALKARSPDTKLEVLIPDFRGEPDCLAQIVAAGPDVVAHNLETVRRLTPTVRDHRAGYDQSLAVLRSLKRLKPGLPTKSSIMLGLGETREELNQAFGELRAAGVDVLTLGQYLQPSEWNLKVERFVPPSEFEELREEALALGYLYVAAGPLVRSSYRAAEFFMEAMLHRGPSPELEGSV